MKNSSLWAMVLGLALFVVKAARKYPLCNVPRAVSTRAEWQLETDTVPAKLSAENCVSLMPPPSDDPVVFAERIELTEVMGELTMMERALIRPVTPWILICRLPLDSLHLRGTQSPC